MTVNCTKCPVKIKDGEGRFNYPSGTLCMKCGEKVNKLLDKAEKLVAQYRTLTGYSGTRIKHF